MRKRFDLTEKRNAIEPTLFEKLFSAGGVPLSPTSQRSAELERRSEEYRVRCEEQADEKVVIEYIEDCGERALAAEWVQEKIHFARMVLAKDFSTLERTFAALDPSPPIIYALEPNGSPVSRDVAIKRLRKRAQVFLYAIGRALANVGSGRDKELSPEEAKQKKRESTKKSKRVLDEAKRLAKSCEMAILADLNKLPLSERSDRLKRREAVKRYAVPHIKNLLAGRTHPERKAGKLLQQRVDSF